MDRILVLLINLTILVGCCRNGDNSYDGSTHTYQVEIESAIYNGQEVKLSDYVTSFDYIPVETNDNFLVSDLFKFSPCDDYIALCCHATQQVYQISNDGKLLKKIGRRGNGKDEYIAVKNVISTPESINVYMGKKIISYYANSGDIKLILNTNDLDNIKLIGSLALFGKDSIAILHNKENNENYLSIINKESIQVDSIRLWETKMRKIDVQLPGGQVIQMDWAYMSALYSFSDTLRVTNDFIDTIFTYKNEDLIPYTIFKYGKLDNNRYEPVLNTDIAFNSLKLMETQNLFLFENMNGVKFIYDKINKETKRIAKFENSNYQGFTNDIDNGIPFWPVAVTKEKMYSFISADIFIEEAAKSNSQKMKQVAATLTEDSNPVIVVATLK